LHYIGNAVVGFGSYINKIKRSIEEKNDLGLLVSLKGFIEKNKAALESGIGEKKTLAIADLLSGIIANQEIETHRKNIFRKLNAKNIADVVAFAVMQGIYRAGEKNGE
jgi:FixJ family two-component response regulator